MKKPTDGGPIYAETDLQNLFAEPWNSISSLAILLPAVYWVIKLRGDYKTYTFIYFCVPLLFIGGLGSILFHGLRAHRLFLYMDFMPTAILMLSVSIYFWHKVLLKVWMVPIVVIATILLRIIFFRLFPALASINSNYFFTGATIFLPVAIYLFRTKLVNLELIIYSLGFLSLALFFRERDHSMTQWLPMGSHFLWHLASGVGAFFLAKYLYKLRRLELE